MSDLCAAMEHITLRFAVLRGCSKREHTGPTEASSGPQGASMDVMGTWKFVKARYQPDCLGCRRARRRDVAHGAQYLQDSHVPDVVVDRVLWTISAQVMELS